MPYTVNPDTGELEYRYPIDPLNVKSLVVQSLASIGVLNVEDSATIGGSASGQSIIASGLVVNEDGGNTATDDFRVETGGQSSAFVVDASTDYSYFNTNVGIGTADPNAKLDVVGDSRFGDSDTNYATFADDGELTLVGTARVYKNEWLNPGAFAVPGTKPATKVDWGVSFGYEFTDGTDDTIYATIRVPQDIDRSVPPELKIGWSSSVATGNCLWQLRYLYCATNEATNAGAQATIWELTAAANVTYGLAISTVQSLATLAVNDQLIMMEIKRRADDASDTLGVDVIMVGCGLRYTSNSLGVGL